MDAYHDGDISMDVEAGREVMSNLSRQGSLGLSKRGSSVGGADVDMGMGDIGAEGAFEGVDLGLDFGEPVELPALEERSRRESESWGRD
jgi:hypothetical protein